MSLLFLPEKHHISILDGGEDTCVLGKGWKILSIHNSRRENVTAFDHETTVKKNLPIVSAITAVDLPNGKSILLVIHESIHNDTSNHSLFSEFQLREHGILIDSTCHIHGSTQRLTITDSNHHDDITIPLELAGCMVHFKHRLPTKEDIMSLQQYCLKQGDIPWNPSTFTDQVADVFYKQVIDTESYNANSMKLFPYDPSEDKNREQKQEVDLKLGSNESRAYQSVILDPKLQFQLDHLRQLHIIDKNEDDHDRSWECIKVLKYPEDRTDDDDVEHGCLVE
jgi:hypothetical protein